MNNRGQAALVNIFIFIIVVFILTVVCGLFYYIATTTYTELSDNADLIQQGFESDGDDEGHNATVIIDQTIGQITLGYESLKWVTVMLIIGYALAVLMAAYLTQTRPIVFIPYIFIVILATILAAPVSNTYEEIYTNPTLASSFSGFFGMNMIMTNLPVWVAVIGLVSGILMFINMNRFPGAGGGGF